MAPEGALQPRGGLTNPGGLTGGDLETLSQPQCEKWKWLLLRGCVPASLKSHLLSQSSEV